MLILPNDKLLPTDDFESPDIDGTYDPASELLLWTTWEVSLTFIFPNSVSNSVWTWAFITESELNPFKISLTLTFVLPWLIAWAADIHLPVMPVIVVRGFSHNAKTGLMFFQVPWIGFLANLIITAEKLYGAFAGQVIFSVFNRSAKLLYASTTGWYLKTAAANYRSVICLVGTFTDLESLCESSYSSINHNSILLLIKHLIKLKWGLLYSWKIFVFFNFFSCLVRLICTFIFFHHLLLQCFA